MSQSRPTPELPADDEIILGVAGPRVQIRPGGKVDEESIRLAARRASPGGVASDNDSDNDNENTTEDDAELRRVTFHINRDLEKRLDRYLTDRIGFMSRTQLQRVIKGGGVLVNNRPPKVSTVLRKGDTVEVVVPPPPDKNIQPENIPLDVLYEDEFLIVLNKQPDIIVHPARSHLKGTMLSALAYHFQNNSTLGGNLSAVGHDLARPGVVHRLDRHTSGCIVFAKQDEAHWKLGHQFEHRTVDKRYLAVVRGKIEPDNDVINLPIGNHPSREKGYREKYVVRHDEAGKHAVTIYRVREHYTWDGPSDRSVRMNEPEHAGSNHYTLVELELKTGRTHQIRVHLSHLGYPIVGDDMYGGRPFLGRDGKPIIERQALHACVLGFTHPITEKRMVFTAPLRGDIAGLVKELRTGLDRRPEANGATVDLNAAVG